ncbi:MAG: hypothetical protein ACI4SF_10785, partial [Oscillospiraceae bacterium]
AQSDKRVNAAEAYSVYKVGNETHHKSLDPFLKLFILLQIKAYPEAEGALIYSSRLLIANKTRTSQRLLGRRAVYTGLQMQNKL